MIANKSFFRWKLFLSLSRSLRSLGLKIERLRKVTAINNNSNEEDDDDDLKEREGENLLSFIMVH